ncbi:MAG TPA: transcription initiation factor IIB [Nitrososphaeraceae archaeon]|nr:transcription initiation factor IIB [Nitrososphaeraceae archaeon]
MIAFNDRSVQPTYRNTILFRWFKLPDGSLYPITPIKVEKSLNNKKTIRTTSVTCSVCRNNYTDIITDSESGEVFCSHCGIVITDKSEDISNPEWRAFTAEELNERARTGAPTSLARHDRGLATIISKTGRDASGQKLDTVMQSTYKRLRTWDYRINHYGSLDRNLFQAFSQLRVLKDKLGLSDTVIEKTAYIYRKAEDRGLVRGRSIAGMVTAAIYIACREIGTPRTLNEIAAIGDIKRKNIARCCRLLIGELDLKVPMIDPIKCIVKIANKADLSEKITRQAINMMTEIIKSKISAGKNPMSFAATVLYLSCLRTGWNVTQLDIAKAGGVTEVTIRNRIKEINTTVGYSSPDEM